MWDIGLNVSCILVKRSEVEVKFVRAARGRVLSVIRGTQVTMWVDTGTQRHRLQC